MIDNKPLDADSKSFRRQKATLERFPTGWRFADSVHYVDCPRCCAPKGFYCQSPIGRVSRTPHAQRLKEYSKLLTEKET